MLYFFTGYLKSQGVYPQMRLLQIGPRGELSLPQHLRELLGIEAGDRVQLYMVGNELHIRKISLTLHTNDNYTAQQDTVTAKESKL